MNIGKKNRRIVLWQQGAGQDADGQPNGAWTELVTVWGSIKFLSGSRAIQADSLLAKSVATIQIRYRTGLTTALRASYGGTTFKINAVLPDEVSKQWVDLACEVVA